MGETDYGALFGLDTDTGAEAADSAQGSDPAEETDAQGGKEQEAADPAVGDGESTAEGGVQSPEVNSRYAAARRRAEAERDAAVLKAREESAAETTRQIEATLGTLGLTNPYTKQPIKTVADLKTFQAGRQEDAKRRLMTAGNMTEEQYQQYVADLPEVKAAREQQSAADDAAKKVMANEARVKLESQMAEITALAPEIKSVDDLKKMENYDRFYKLVKENRLSLVDAYRLVNADKITADRTAATRQAALNAANSKNHLDRTTTRGAGTVTVPRDIAEEYRAMMPGITDAEIQAHYNKYKQKK